jgi:hypothetical protein
MIAKSLFKLAATLCAVLSSSVVWGQGLGADITTICSGSATVTVEIQDACNAARLAVLKNVAQISTNAVEQSTLLAQSSLTTAHIAQLASLRAAMVPNSTTLAAIRPGTVTTPDMDATIYAELVTATKVAAAKEAEQVVGLLRGKICSVMLHDSSVSSVIRNQKNAKATVSLLSEGIDRHISNMRALEIPMPQGGLFGRDSLGINLQRFSITASLPAISLALDVVSNASALIASFRPTVSSDSSTVTAAFDKLASTAFIASVVSNDVSVVTLDGILALAPAEDGLRLQINGLTKLTKDLVDLTLKVSKYDYSAPDVQAGALEPEKKKAAEAQAIAKKNNETRQALVNDAKKLLDASDNLRRGLLTDTPSTGDGKPLTPAPIHDFDRLDALFSQGQTCLYTLKIDKAEGMADRFAKQHAFGSPDYSARVVGTLPWMLMNSSGRIVGAGNILVDSGWRPFGPAK